MADAKKGMSAAQLQRHIGMTYKTAWYVCHRIREAMREESETKLGGNGVTVEIDETYIGGVKRFMGVGPAKDAKTLVIGMAERGGRIHLQAIPDRSAKSIKPVIQSKIDPDTQKYVTDGHAAYEFILPRDRHEVGNHRKELKDRSWTTTQTIENAFSLFKRGIVGNYHQLSPWHLTRYMREFCWRYNRRGLQPWIFGMTLNNMVCRKPLPYKELVKF
jgi:transposase-like protein